MLGIVNFQIRLPRPHLRSINNGTPPQQIAKGTQARIEFFEILYDHERHPKALLPIAAH